MSDALTLSQPGKTGLLPQTSSTFASNSHLMSSSSTNVMLLQMYSMPVFDMIEAAFRQWGLTRRKLITRLLMRTVYVVFTCFVAVTLPFFGGRPAALLACLLHCCSLACLLNLSVELM